MAGVLQFTLGLETHAFLRGIGVASGGIVSLAGIAQGLRGVMANVWGAIEKGGGLTDLRARTGASVGDLYRLQEAFKDVGLEAGLVGGMVNRLQQSLGGVGERGKRPLNVLKAMGLDPEAVRRSGAVEQFGMIAAAMQRLSADSGMGAAAVLFGEQGAGAMAQIARDADAFRRVLVASGREAEVFERFANRFDAVGDAAVRIRSQIGGMWAGMAGGALPALEKAMVRLGAFDWVGFGERMGSVAGTISEGLVQGRLGELLELSLKSAVMGASNTMLEEIGKWGAAAGRALGGGEGGGGKIWAGVKGVTAGLFGLWNEFGSMLGVPGASEKADQRIDEAMRNFAKAGLGGGLMDGIAEAMLQGKQGLPNIYKEQLAALQEELARKAADMGGAAGGTGRRGELGGGSLSRPEARTEWERIGLVLSGGGVSDYGKRTAEHTGQMVAEQKRTNELLMKTAGAAGDFRRIA